MATMTRLLYIANSRLPTDNAHGVQIIKMCEAFAKAGASVTLIHPWRINRHKGDPFSVYMTERNFRLITVPSLDLLWMGRIGFWIQNVTFSKTVALYLLFNTFDIVYSRDELPLLLASYVTRTSVWESHTGRYNGLVRRLLARISSLVVITQSGKEFYAKKRFPKEKIQVAPDAVALEDFAHPESKEEARTRLGLPDDKRIALYIGKFDGWKGTETLCEASQYVPNDTVIALIGGEPEEIADLKTRYPKCVFAGWRPYQELVHNQAAADVLILPSSARSEISRHFTSPLKLFTYMASDRPIVASDLPSIREILTEDLAFFFKPDDAKDLAAQISYALENTQEADRKAQAAKELVKRYTWDARAREILDAIEVN